MGRLLENPVLQRENCSSLVCKYRTLHVTQVLTSLSCLSRLTQYNTQKILNPSASNIEQPDGRQHHKISERTLGDGWRMYIFILLWRCIENNNNSNCWLTRFCGGLREHNPVYCMIILFQWTDWLYGNVHLLYFLWEHGGSPFVYR